MNVDDFLVNVGVICLIGGVLCAVAAVCNYWWGDIDESIFDSHFEGDCRVSDCDECALDQLASCPFCGCTTNDMRFHENCMIYEFDNIDWERD
jgi:hypothetical protein